MDRLQLLQGSLQASAKDADFEAMIDQMLEMAISREIQSIIQRSPSAFSGTHRNVFQTKSMAA